MLLAVIALASLVVGAEPGARNRLAVAVPFHSSQVQAKLIPGLRRWAQEEFFPCDHPPTGGREAALVFVYAGHSEDDLVGDGVTLKQALEGLAFELKPVTERCFLGGIHFMQADVPPEHDHYADAPCVVFQDMLQQLRGKGDYDHVFQMETDVLPVRQFWLDALLDEAQVNTGCKRFWQLGSMAHCQPLQGQMDQRFDVHINGNSLWCLNDPGLWDYIDRVKAFYPAGDHSGVAGCGTSQFAETGVDHALYRFRRDPANWEYVQSIFHKFQYTEVILNKCEDSYSLANIRTKHADTFLVHSKAPFLPEGIVFARELVAEIFNRWPQHHEQQRLAALVDAGRWGKDQLAAYLCESEEHVRLIQSKNPSPTCQQLCDSSPGLFPQYDKVCALSLLKKQWLDWEPDKAYVWTTDLHSGPMACNVPVLNEAGALVHGEIDFGNCIYTKKYQPLCKDRLKVLEFDEWRGFSLDPCPNYLRHAFFEAYKNDPEFERVDAFICSHPAANCELYMPFNRSLIVYPTTRLEFGRDDDSVDWRQPYENLRSKARWAEWVANMQRIAANPMNVIAGNSKYEVEYIRYHTGIDAMYLPSWCGDKTDNNVLAPTTDKILLGPYRDNLDYPRFDEEEAWKHPIMTTMLDAAKEWKRSHGSAPEFVRLRQHYKHYEFSDLQSHPCIVIIPYQVSVISFFEYYRLNIPLFVPSKSLLVQWVMEHKILWERTYGHPDHLVPDVGIPDPASDTRESLEYWLGFSDYYQFEHVIEFDSWQDFMLKYQTTDLMAVRYRMAQSNAQQRADLVETWSDLLAKIKQANTPRREMPKHFTHALQQIYQAPGLGPDLPISLDPDQVRGDVVQLAQQCPVISESLPRCMCVNGTMPNTAAPECHHLPRCIPSEVYFPPRTNDTNRIEPAYDNWNDHELAIRGYGEAWNAHLEQHKADPKPACDMLRIAPSDESLPGPDHITFTVTRANGETEEHVETTRPSTQPSAQPSVLPTALQFPAATSREKSRRSFNRRKTYSWRRATGTGTTTNAPTPAPSPAPTATGVATEQTTTTFDITVSQALTVSQVNAMNDAICTYLTDNSDSTVTWTCTTALQRRVSYTTTSVATYPATSATSVTNLVVTNAATTQTASASSATTAVVNAGATGVTVTVNSLTSSTTCTANCDDSDSGLATWVIVVSAIAGAAILGVIVAAVVYYFKFSGDAAAGAAGGGTASEPSFLSSQTSGLPIQPTETEMGDMPGVEPTAKGDELPESNQM